MAFPMPGERAASRRGKKCLSSALKLRYIVVMEVLNTYMMFLMVIIDLMY